MASTASRGLPALSTHAGPLVMGVLNVTPDSFSDGGRFVDAAQAVAHARELIVQGADIIDVGGESTRPGARLVSPEEELRRVLPVVRALAEDGITVSIDTVRAETAQAAVSAGARYINDVSGGTYDPAMYPAASWAAAEHGASLIIGHWRGVPDENQRRSHYTNVVTDVRNALAAQAREAVEAGLPHEHIVLDPGLGFDKTGEQGWRILAEIDELAALGYPILIGVSRKRMLAEAIGYPTRPEDRDLATAVVSALAAQTGVWGVRVHDVGSTVQALSIAEAWRDAAQYRDGEKGCFARGEAAGFETSAGDRIAIAGLEVFAHHGVFDFEREQGQRFIIDVTVSVDLRAAAADDALERTVHYGDLAETIVSAVQRDPVDLIETVAERVADVALGFEGVREAQVTVHKPDAPIEAAFADVTVSVVRRRATPIVLAFGSNLGRRAETIRAALAEIAAAPGIDRLRVSPLRESVALKLDGPDPDAPGYVNGVAIATTTLTPHELLDLVQTVENRHGRVRGERWGDRTLDIDIVSYGDVGLRSARLTLPHPRAHERDFVLAPWLDLDPAAILPGHGPVAALLTSVGDTTRVVAEDDDARR